MQVKRPIELWRAGILTSMVVFVISLLLFHYQSDRFVGPTVAQTTTLNFSWEPLHLLSPDRVYVVENDVYECTEGAGSTLFLKKAGNPNRIKICDINRNVDVSWSPDSKSFALNDWYGSDISESYIYRLSEPQKLLLGHGRLQVHPLSLVDNLMASDIPREVKETIATQDHNYISVVHWYGARLLLVKAFGHICLPGRGVKEYTFHFTLDLESNKWTLLKNMEFES